MRCPSTGGCLAFLVAVAVLLAGCTVTTPPSESPGSTGTTPPSEFDVTVREVVDGDTVTVAFPNGRVEDVRLLGVDTPEVAGETSPGEFEGVPDTDAGRAHLRTWGARASEFAASRLDVGESVRIAVDSGADRRGSYGRLLVYLYDDGDLFNRLLLERGYARLYDSTFEKRSGFASAERQAREDGVGLWGSGGATPTPGRFAPGTAARAGAQIPKVARSMSRVPGPRPTATMATSRRTA